MSIPGFIKFLKIVDFIVDREIARGGFGVVWLGQSISQEMLNRTRGVKEIVVKEVCKSY